MAQYENGLPLHVKKHHGQTFLGGLGHVFHCNHYNAYLQMAVLLSEGIAGCDPKRLLADAVVPLVTHLERSGYSQQDLMDEFAYCGFGKLRKMRDEKWMTPYSHYGQAALMQGEGSLSCYFTAGYLSGMNHCRMEEVRCKQQRAPLDIFEPRGELAEGENPFRFTPHYTEAPSRFDFPGCQQFSTLVDEQAIMEAVSGLPLYGKGGLNDTGLIDAFGVVLTNHYADYYNLITYETYHQMVASGVSKEDVRNIFVQGGHICAFNTFGGIMSSPEWYQLVVPSCRSDTDWIHGMVAVINCLGWGIWRVEEVREGERLVIRIYNSYEGTGYRRLYPPIEEKEISFLNIGAVQGLAHLLWKIDIKQRPELTQEYYANVFEDPGNSFHATQTHAIAAGDNYDRIVVSR